VTSPFGSRDGRLHAGLDIGAPKGTLATAAAGGIVSFAGTQSGYGNIVVIEHPGGTSTAYAHLSKISVVVGQLVTQGQEIGLVGSTGRSTGPHLHFEIRENGHAVDPLPRLPAR
jgi:murein DD-endopeptidase MepM/ murein hydrolase activator NlpD